MAQVAVLCIVGAVLGLLMKKNAPETALLLTLAVGAVILLCLLQDAGEILEFLQELTEETAVPQAVFKPLLKTVGIALVAKVGSDLCRDAGESALASLTETAGAICAILAALPLLRSVIKLLLELL